MRITSPIFTTTNESFGKSMNILVTGGSGFLGQSLIQRLLSQQSVLLDSKTHKIECIVSFDQGVGVLSHAQLRYATGDIANAATVQTLFKTRFDLVIHLAAVVSGTAEANFDLGMAVNLDGTRYILEACRAQGNQPRLLFASSIAVFGGVLPTVVTDATTPTPQGSYGIQKYIGEQFVQDYSRKGFIDGRSVRVPTVVVRPGSPNGAASGFASGIVREPLAGKTAVLPVPDNTAMWVASPRSVVSMLLHAIALEAKAWGLSRSINLPGLTVTMREELDSLRAIAGDKVVERVVTHLDPQVQRLVTTWPARFDVQRAHELGFKADQNFNEILLAYMQDNPAAIVR
jgi:D-erythronate 2-dehydrogenase